MRTTTHMHRRKRRAKIVLAAVAGALVLVAGTQSAVRRARLLVHADEQVLEGRRQRLARPPAEREGHLSDPLLHAGDPAPQRSTRTCSSTRARSTTSTARCSPRSSTSAATAPAAAPPAAARPAAADPRAAAEAPPPGAAPRVAAARPDHPSLQHARTEQRHHRPAAAARARRPGAVPDVRRGRHLDHPAHPGQADDARTGARHEAPLTPREGASIRREFYSARSASGRFRARRRLHPQR